MPLLSATGFLVSHFPMISGSMPYIKSDERLPLLLHKKCYQTWLFQLQFHFQSKWWSHHSRACRLQVVFAPDSSMHGISWGSILHCSVTWRSSLGLLLVGLLWSKRDIIFPLSLFRSMCNWLGYLVKHQHRNCSHLELAQLHGTETTNPWWPLLAFQVHTSITLCICLQPHCKIKKKTIKNVKQILCV